MGLETYRHKRNFRITPEPAGGVLHTKAKGLSFVIQKHAASHLHYDFRLELDGVMLSWAIPKGPSLDPNDRRLAAHVEDHPLEYATFEGIIPQKQYGGGTVLLWDRGTWIPKEDPQAGYRKGKLKFELQGEKLRGGWTLVRSRGSKYAGKDNAWLLIKEDDEFAMPARDASIIEEAPLSVATGRTLEEIAAEKDSVWESTKSVAANVKALKQGRKRHVAAGRLPGAKPASMPDFIQPNLATMVKETPRAGKWLYELKYDGYRMLCKVKDGKATMVSRNGKNWTANFPHLAAAAARLPLDEAWLDGEVVVLDDQGRSSFQALQNVLSLNSQSRLIFYLFDVMYLDGHDLRAVPLAERKATLERLLETPPAGIRYSSHLDGEGEAFFLEACRLGLEGVIAKQADSPYRGGRFRNWLKIKCARRQEFVIGGWSDPEGSRNHFGALLLGVYEKGGALRYVGKVGTGFNERMLADIIAKLRPLQQDKAPFHNPPRGAEARRSHWVKPELVGEVRFTEWTADQTLRHPSFLGLREDKKAREVIREEATNVPPAKAKAAKRPAGDEFKLTNPDKLLYPDAGISKKDLVEFYLKVGKWILPHLEGRPLSLVRCPDGWDKQCFFEKRLRPSYGEAIEAVEVSTSEGPANYMMVNSLQGLLSLIQLGVLEIHPWGSRLPELDKPDRVVFDLDPDDALPWERLAEAARLVNTLLDNLGLQGFLKTTGGKGLHVVVPIRPTQSWDVVKAFAKAVAELLARTFPDRFTSKISKFSRKGKIFIDYLRNGEGATAVAAYSIRARSNAPVATPIHWHELRKDVRFDHFNLGNLPARLAKLGKDPWAGFFAARQALTSDRLAKVGMAFKE